MLAHRLACGPAGSAKEDRMAATIENPRHTVSPVKIAHALFATRALAPMRDWYRTVFEARVVFESPDFCFLSYDDEHHRIAIVRQPDAEKRGAAMPVGVHHIAFAYRALDDLLHTYLRLKQADITPYWAVNHGPSTSLY